MGVYIKGMDMPIIEMEWTIRHGADGKWYAIDTNAETSDGEWHEIIHIPPHGDLIDRDALYEKIPFGDIEHDTRISRNGAIADVCTWVLSAPTIIHADGKDGVSC